MSEERQLHIQMEQLPLFDLDVTDAADPYASSQQPDILRSYREGEVVVEEPDGKYRAVVTLEYSYATGPWWMAQRRVGTNQIAVGVFHGDWVEREGEGLDDLDERLREWVDIEGIELGNTHQELTPNEGTPSILMGEATLNAQPPLDPKVYAEIVGNMVDRELMQAPMPGAPPDA